MADFDKWFNNIKEEIAEEATYEIEVDEKRIEQLAKEFLEETKRDDVL